MLYYLILCRRSRSTQSRMGPRRGHPEEGRAHDHGHVGEAPDHGHGARPSRVRLRVWRTHASICPRIRPSIAQRRTHAYIRPYISPAIDAHQHIDTSAQLSMHACIHLSVRPSVHACTTGCMITQCNTNTVQDM